jgi:5'-nucleotidase
MGAVTSRITLSALLLASLLGCTGASAGSGAPSPPSGAAPSAAPSAAASGVPSAATVDITVLGTSDLHGHLSTLPLLASYVRALRAKNPDGVVLVDAGDMFQGTIESNMNEGAAVIDAYKKLGYDAAALGNHEFDYGPVGEPSTVRKDAKEGPDRDPRGAIKARALQAKGAFPLLAANLLEDDHALDWPNVLPSTIVTKHGVQVGIIGVTTSSTLKTTISANVVGIKVLPLADTIAEQAKALRDKGAKVVVVAAHAGGNCSNLENPADLSSCEAGAEIFEVAKKLPAGAVDLIVGGHTHKAVAHQVAGIPVVQANAYGTAFDHVDITVDTATGKVVRTTIHKPEQVAAGALFEGATISPDPEVSALIAPAIEHAKAKRAEPLNVTLSGPFPAKYREECALGNMVTSLLLELEPKADIAIANGGGLRADLPAGPLTYGSLYEALPFDNRLARLTMSGEKLRECFTKNLAGKGGVLSVAGARVEGHCDKDKLAVDIVLTGKKKQERKLKDTDKVLVVTNEFLATGGDDFGPPEKVEIEDGAPPFRDPISALLQKKGGTLKPEDWLLPGKPRLVLPGPAGAHVCSAAK